MSSDKIKGMGWLHDLPDFRDYTIETSVVPKQKEETGIKRSVRANLELTGVLQPAKTPRFAKSVDLRAYCSPVEDQGNLGSCTAHAGIGMVEYFERRAFGRHIDASRLFLYKVTRNLLGAKGDTGAYLRTTMAALVCFGAPPEQYLPYDAAHFDDEPSAFLYAFGQNFKSISYYRLDPPNTPVDTLLHRIKTLLAAKLPSMFGFSVYSSIQQATPSGSIPFPTEKEDVLGGHAVMAVGYDDAKIIPNTNPGGKETKGALLIRNSWGPDWGEAGYGWLPYEFVTCGLAVDWWSILKADWVDTGNFGL